MPKTIWWNNHHGYFAAGEGFEIVDRLDSDILLFCKHEDKVVSLDKEFESDYPRELQMYIGWNGSRQGYAQSPLQPGQFISKLLEDRRIQIDKTSTMWSLFLTDLTTKGQVSLSPNGPRCGGTTFSWALDDRLYYVAVDLGKPKKHVAAFSSECWPYALMRWSAKTGEEALVELPWEEEVVDKGEWKNCDVAKQYGLLSVSPDCRFALLRVSRSDSIDGGIRLVDIQNGAVKDVPVHNDAPRACWSPDSKEFAFCDSRGIVVCSVDDPTKQRIPIGETGKEINWPWGRPDSWSPDGKWIVVDLPITMPGWVMVSPDGSKRMKILRPFEVIYKEGRSCYSVFRPLGVYYSVWSKDGRYVAGDVLVGQFIMKDREVDSSCSWNYYFIADMVEKKIAFFPASADYSKQVFLIEDKDAIEKIRKTGVAWNDIQIRKDLTRIEKEWQEMPKPGNPKLSWCDLEGKVSMYNGFLIWAYRRASLSTEVRRQVIEWLKSHRQEAKASWEKIRDISAVGVRWHEGVDIPE